MTGSRWKRLVQAWLIAIGVFALLAWPMHLGRDRIIEAAAVAFAVATVVGLYERAPDGAGSGKPTV